jgi:Mg2+/Co2+ transporter CorB
MIELHICIELKQKSEDEYVIDGSVSIRDVNRELNWDLPETEATTIAGFVINEMKRIKYKKLNNNQYKLC